jgi:hypothetical protein
MCPACPRVAGRVREERWKFSRSPSSAARDARPADDIFAYPGCPQPVPSRSACPGPDPRKRRGRRHPLAGLLAVGIAAVIAGSRSRRRGRRGAAARGGTPPMIPLAVLQPVIDAFGVAPRIEAMLPAGVRAASLRSVPCWPACAWPRPITGPRRPRPPGADLAQRGRPAAARRHHWLEERPARTHLPANRAHLRSGHRRACQGRTRRAAVRALQAFCDDLREASTMSQ